MDNTSHSSHSRGFAALLPHGTSHDHATAKPCCDTGGHRLPSGHTMPRIVFIGNPNVGKSSLFNALLGAKARVMNAPGTTVLLEEGVYTTTACNGTSSTRRAPIRCCRSPPTNAWPPKR